MTLERMKAADFIQALNEGNLVKPGLQLVGLTKPSGNKKELSFSLGLSCSRWITIPEKLVDHIDWLGDITCGDHTHPLVQLSFKATTTDEGKLFSELLENAAVGMTLSPADSASFATGMPAHIALAFCRCPPGYVEEIGSNGRIYCVPQRRMNV
ncbi:hypothetical protein [Muricoccus pecuniae]|uniref:Uncharacterized protein n=1 Tax=Muricoccus pecuniae TaxID=693023 RepID=A0A840YH82_9PROT|nr:hypothetical protein [Roseomonas pecuniae]MBB5695797.1 hypothetical protein [Roseomonas pecuniae]